MKIQFLNGGLANQAFQYIFARYYELSHPGQIMYLDDSYFALNTVHNGYELERVFGIKPHFLSENFPEQVWQSILEEKKRSKSTPQILKDGGLALGLLAESENYKDWNPYDGEVMSIPNGGFYPGILEAQGNIYYHGYWINGNWFKTYEEVFRKELSFPVITDEKNQNYLAKIKTTNSVSIHIRRGDYVTLGWNYENDIYKQMCEVFTEAFTKKWTVFVFSDDIPWCQANAKEIGFDLFEDIVFVEGNVNGKNYIDMQLMSQCKGMLMSNSAFCYLAALLNRNKDYILNLTDREL